MIEVRLIEGQRRLFCVEDTEFSFAPVIITVKAGTVGAVVSLEPGTVVDWWASEGITVHENTVIENSYITAETGDIEPYAVILNSHVVCGNLLIRSYLDDQSSLRNCFIITMDTFHLIVSRMSRVNIGDSCSIVVLNSDMGASRITGNVNCIASKVSNLNTRGSSANLSVFGNILKDAGLTAPNLNLIRSQVKNTEIADGVSNLLMQSSQLRDSKLNSDAILSGSILERSILDGTMFHFVNAKFIRVHAKSESPTVMAVNLTQDNERVTELQLDYSVITGDNTETVVS